MHLISIILTLWPFVIQNQGQLPDTLPEYADKGTQLIYQDSKKMAITSVWMEVEGQQYEQIAAKLAWELVYKCWSGLMWLEFLQAQVDRIQLGV